MGKLIRMFWTMILWFAAFAFVMAIWHSPAYECDTLCGQWGYACFVTVVFACVVAVTRAIWTGRYE